MLTTASVATEGGADAQHCQGQLRAGAARKEELPLQGKLLLNPHTGLLGNRKPEQARREYQHGDDDSQQVAPVGKPAERQYEQRAHGPGDLVVW